MLSIALSVSDCTLLTTARMFSVASAVSRARLLTSPATTANPLPASFARAASPGSAAGPSWRDRSDAAQFTPGHRPKVHLVGAVGDAQRTRGGVHRSEWYVVAHARPTVHLDRVVDHLAGNPRCDDLDGGDLGGRLSCTQRVD